MSFYSSLCLVANDRVRAPADDEVFQLLSRVGALEPARARNEFYNLSDELIAFFEKHEARSENDRFFVPDTISFRSGIEIMDPDGDYIGNGWSLRIHGNGYFYPLSHSDLGAFVRLPTVARLQTELETVLGGRFRPPLFEGRGTLARTAVANEGAWRWFGSQSL